VQITAKGNPTGIVLTAPMLMAINDSDDPVSLVRHLSESPELSVEISEMSPKRMERRLLKLELQIPDAPLRVFEDKVRDLPRKTEAERLVVQRIGQDIFRAALMTYWDGRRRDRRAQDRRSRCHEPGGGAVFLIRHSPDDRRSKASA
jgi:hypothetical protein